MNFQCPHCQQDLEVEEEWEEHCLDCPVCGGELITPSRDLVLQETLEPAFEPMATKTELASSNHSLKSRDRFKFEARGPGPGKFLVFLLVLAGAALAFACYHLKQAPNALGQQVFDFVEKQIYPPATVPPQPAPKVVIVPKPVPVVVAAPTKPAPPQAVTNAVAAPAPPPEDPLTWFLNLNDKSPHEVTLLSDTNFPIIYDGRISGSGIVPAGSELKVVKADLETKEVTLAYPVYGNSTASVPFASTDLVNRAKSEEAKADAKQKAEEERKPTESAAPPVSPPASPPSPPTNAVPQPAALAESTSTTLKPTDPGASTHTASAENATLNPSAVGADGGPNIPELARKILPPGEKSPLITSFTPTVHEVRNATSGLLHPGIFQTKEELDTMQRHVRNGDQPWASAFAEFSQVRNCSTDPPILYAGWTDIPHGGGLGKGGNFVTFRMAKDANTAYKQVVMWYITGNETYRLNALKIIRDYCAIKTIGFHWDAQIRWGVASYQMCCAAEVLRYSDGNTENSRWTDDDAAQFSALMQAGEKLVAPTGYWMNQHGFSTMGVMGTGIFLDDKALYDEAVERTTVNSRGEPGGRNGSIEWQMRLVTENFETHEKVTPQVQLVEMMRDQSHAWDDVAVLSTLCQTIYNQGTKVDPVTGTASTAANAVDVFEFLDNRFLAGVDYITRYTLGAPVTWIPIDMGDQIKGAPGKGFYILGILYNHYKYIEKWSTTDPRFHAVAEAYESEIPESDAVDVPGASTLLLTPDNAAASPNSLEDSVTPRSP